MHRATGSPPKGGTTRMNSPGRSVYYQSVQRNPLSPTVGGARCPPFDPNGELFYSTKSAGGSGMPERRSLQATMGQKTKMRKPTVEFLSVTSSCAAGPDKITSDVGVGDTLAETPPPEPKVPHANPKYVRGELVQVQDTPSSGWTDARVLKVTLYNEYEVLYEPMKSTHPLFLKSNSIEKRIPEERVRRSTLDFAVGEYAEATFDGVSVYCKISTKTDTCYTVESTRGREEVGLGNLIKDPILGVGDHVLAWVCRGGGWRDCKIVSTSPDGFRCDDYSLYPRSSLRLKRPGIDWRVLQHAVKSSQDPSEIVAKLHHCKEVTEMLMQPSSTRSAAAAETDFQQLFTAILKEEAPVGEGRLLDLVLHHSRPEPDWYPLLRCSAATLPDPFKEISAPPLPFRRSPYTVFSLVMSTISAIIVLVAMFLPYWRLGQFSATLTDNIDLGLYSVDVPYANLRNNAYSGVQKLFSPSSSFKDWTPNIAGEVGIEWDTDDMNTFKEAGAVGLVFCLLAVLFQAWVFERWWHAQPVGFAFAILFSGCLSLTAILCYSLIIFESFSIRQDHPLVGHESSFGVSWYLVLSCGMTNILLGALAGMLSRRQRSTRSPATCGDCKKDMSICQCGSGRCPCYVCNKPPELYVPGKFTLKALPASGSVPLPLDITLPPTATETVPPTATQPPTVSDFSAVPDLPPNPPPDFVAVEILSVTEPVGKPAQEGPAPPVRKPPSFPMPVPAKEVKPEPEGPAPPVRKPPSFPMPAEKKEEPKGPSPPTQKPPSFPVADGGAKGPEPPTQKPPSFPVGNKVEPKGPAPPSQKPPSFPVQKSDDTKDEPKGPAPPTQKPPSFPVSSEASGPAPPTQKPPSFPVLQQVEKNEGPAPPAQKPPSFPMGNSSKEEPKGPAPPAQKPPSFPVAQEAPPAAAPPAQRESLKMFTQPVITPVAEDLTPQVLPAAGSSEMLDIASHKRMSFISSRPPPIVRPESVEVLEVEEGEEYEEYEEEEEEEEEEETTPRITKFFSKLFGRKKK
eukprot:TRINITY_DN1975_c0_g1_i1.p1 TRINITY_DN1975_c0_g1~~TRINITY_DN1975_c0_g1_i1.p1  ORF type:complete len:1018 (+),score=180.07 TRINITY_DN1975_c0_g1_i1:103-3156(+)